MKLNIGSGYSKPEGFVNIDCDSHCNPDILLELDDVNLILPFDDNSIDEIRAYHILEHIGIGFPRLMQEMYRVLIPGGIIDIKLPHPHHDIAIIDHDHKRQLLPESFRLFSKKYNELEIARGGSSSTHGIRYGIDFEIVDYKFTYDSFYDNIVPGMSELMVQRLFREALNVALESHTIIMAIK